MTPHDHPPRPTRHRLRTSRFPLRTLWVALFTCAALASAGADEPDTDSEMVQLDFQNAELTDVIDTIAKLTKTNFIYDDRVRGRVTIISPTPVPIEQAYAVFESVLQVKGFTTVRTPGGALKVIPLREAKETSVETSRSTEPPPNRDTFITRLIPLRYIESESIVNTLKPLVSKDAAIASYGPTNTVILTESSSNIRRIIAILENIDIETYREEIAVIRIEFADASTMASQVAEIFGATVTAASGRTPRASRRGAKPATTPARAAGELGKVRIITDERTNALIVLAPKTQIEEVRRLVHKLDVPVTGGGRIHVYYLQHADAEDLAQTLSSMISGTTRPGGGAGGGQGGTAQAIRTQVAGLASGIGVTADPATNSLVIQASKEGFNTISAVIKKLDVARPQVLVEALIMEVLVTDDEELGFNGLVKIVQGDNEYVVALATDVASSSLLGGLPTAANLAGLGDLVGGARSGDPTKSETAIQGILRLAAKDASTNIISAPHILTSDNEEAEIRLGSNIPIVSSRVEAAAGAPALSSSVNVERQDIGVTLRVTPQITEGNTLRLDIFQELTSVDDTLTDDISASTPESGVALRSRQIENTVVVGDGETVVIGGLINEEYADNVSKVPWLGDIPFLGWAFKTTTRKLQKKNLLVFLTPHIIRSTDDLEKETIRKRQEFVDRTAGSLRLSEREQAWEHKEMERAAAAGERYEPGRGLNPVRHAILDHEVQYPLDRMREIERLEREAAERKAQEPNEKPTYFLQAGLFSDEDRAIEAITAVLDLGFDGTLLTADRAGALLYEVRVGPYETLDDARLAIRVLERAQGLSPSVLVVEAPAP